MRFSTDNMQNDSTLWQGVSSRFFIKKKQKNNSKKKHLTWNIRRSNSISLPIKIKCWLLRVNAATIWLSSISAASSKTTVQSGYLEIWLSNSEHKIYQLAPIGVCSNWINTLHRAAPVDGLMTFQWCASIWSVGILQYSPICADLLHFFLHSWNCLQFSLKIIEITFKTHALISLCAFVWLTWTCLNSCVFIEHIFIISCCVL